MQTGRLVYGVAADAASNTVYAAVNSEVAVIDGASDTVTAGVSLPVTPNVITVDQASDTVYAIEGGSSATAQVIDGAAETVKPQSACLPG